MSHALQVDSLPAELPGSPVITIAFNASQVALVIKNPPAMQERV